MGVYWEDGRASSAPELEGFNWREWGVPRNSEGRAPVGSADQNEPNERRRQLNARSAGPRCRGHCGAGYGFMALELSGIPGRWWAPGTP
eukprot:14805248-Alexandrium_andersonii.AAC.1